MPLFRSCGSPDIAVSICAQVFQLGGSGEPLGASWGFFGASWILRASWRLGGLLGSPGRLLGPSWRPSLKKEGGFFLAPPPVRAFKWASWGSLGALLGRSWALQDPRAPKSARDPAARDPPRDPPARGADAGLEGWRHDRSYSDEGVNPSPKGRRAEGEEGGWKRNLSKL